MAELTIHADWNAEAAVWSARSADVPGLTIVPLAALTGIHDATVDSNDILPYTCHQRGSAGLPRL